ncbi:hypothetical protein Gogos_016667 [Gossypium gossypioides]|uniref:Myb/SANT-like DNA-binding domain-containing protein n=1 Tax=Gossypium gossypioides TaxID=34282 RepID=A0A7J9B8H9_GOSGO|nr:hypothetical protein [Gossypium gossypioides]
MDDSGLECGFLSGPNGGLFDLESPIQREQRPQIHMVMMTALGNEHRSTGLMEAKGSSQKGFPMNFGKGKGISPVIAITDGSMSEEDEPSYNEDGNGEKCKGKNGWPWKRMKWKDNVVRLLIAVVSCVGDEEGVEGLKRKSRILQKKGKWKTVSKIMISKGCHVSPQQCEDKFNDLNKRYKKLNDILGRGTSCRVVENHSLMDSMPHLSQKAKDDGCIPSERCLKDNNGSDEEEADSEDDDDNDVDDDDDDYAVCEEERMGEVKERKKASAECGGHDGFKFQEGTRSSMVGKDRIKRQMVQLQEERVKLQTEAFKLEKQRFKWVQYCSKKDRELERLRLEKERRRLENEQSILQLRRKVVEVGSLGIDRQIVDSGKMADGVTLANGLIEKGDHSHVSLSPSLDFLFLKEESNMDDCTI